MARKMHRRDMIRNTTLAGVGVWLVGSAARAESNSPNEKLNIAVIGIGGRGRANLNGVARENVVALCDVDDKRAGDAYEKFPKAKKFYDFRKMLEEMDSQIDAVVVSTPDHMHAHPSVMAMRMGKHLYCEKPMAHSVYEARLMTDLAREKKLATQLGVQRHTIKNMHRVVEKIQQGVIGDVTEVHSWIGGSRGMPAIPKDTPPVPDTLKWDLWIGAGPMRSYAPSICPYGWRFWWDYGTGETGNWGCHILDIPFWALDLKYPTEVETTGPPVDPRRTPKSMHARYQFPARGDKPAVTLHWYHGAPEILKEKKLPNSQNGSLFIGSEGMLLTTFSNHRLLPEEKFQDVKVERTIPDSPGFHKEWITACKGGEPATCQFDYSGPLAETVLLGNVAYRVGHKLTWDAAKLDAHSADAERLIKPEFREGWPL